jgi:HAMP domain-containing protein
VSVSPPRPMQRDLASWWALILMNSRLKVTHISHSIKYLYRLPVRSSSQVMARAFLALITWINNFQGDLRIWKRNQDATSKLESLLQQIIRGMRFRETLVQLPYWQIWRNAVPWKFSPAAWLTNMYWIFHLPKEALAKSTSSAGCCDE